MQKQSANCAQGREAWRAVDGYRLFRETDISEKEIYPRIMEHLVLFGVAAMIFATLLSVINARPRQEGDPWAMYNPLLDPDFAVGAPARHQPAESAEESDEATGTEEAAEDASEV
ncbi:MAG: hypothetical protein D6794_11915 [Deltaproteobacteria bacterium]|nr:MAG: hypothetical protein D6794_11915 [Deltaproteobacteria bacterium]